MTRLQSSPEPALEKPPVAELPVSNESKHSTTLSLERSGTGKENTELGTLSAIAYALGASKAALQECVEKNGYEGQKGETANGGLATLYNVNDVASAWQRENDMPSAQSTDELGFVTTKDGRQLGTISAIAAKLGRSTAHVQEHCAELSSVTVRQKNGGTGDMYVLNDVLVALGTNLRNEDADGFIWSGTAPGRGSRLGSVEAWAKEWQVDTATAQTILMVQRGRLPQSEWGIDASGQRQNYYAAPIAEQCFATWQWQQEQLAAQQEAERQEAERRNRPSLWNRATSKVRGWFGRG